MKTSKCIQVAARIFALLLLALLSGAPEIAAQTDAGRTNFDAEDAEAESAQSSGGPFGLEKAANEYGVWGGGSLDSPTLIGKFENARLGLIGLRYARVLARGENIALK
nr:hypothetical protein [Acidobacteriota bacterium]